MSIFGPKHIQIIAPCKKKALFARSALRNTDVAAPTDLPFENIYSMAGTAAGVTLGDDWAT